MRSITFEGPAHYRIVVKGRLAARTVERLGDLRIASAEGEGREAVTVLVGPVRDQAELSGIMNTLYGMHLSVLTLETPDQKKDD